MEEDNMPTMMGLAEIAQYAGVDKSAVSKWRLRHADFPAPLVELAMGAVYDSTDVTTYLAAHNYPRESK